MFVLTARLRRKRAIMAGTLILLLAGLVLLWRGSVSQGGAEARVLRDNRERLAYLSELGWEVTEEPIETLELQLPLELSGGYAAYNELQLSQGFDLQPYLGKAVTRFTYQVENYPDRPEDVQLNLYLWEGQPIAGDIIAGGDGGFQATLRFPGGA